MENLTHILFDLFGTLILYSDSRVDQGYPRSYKLVVDNGFTSTYQTFLSEWDRLYSEFDQRSASSHNEFSMTEICRCFLRKILGKAPETDMVDSFCDTYLSEWNQGVSYISGVNEMLVALSEAYTLALVSNTNHSKLVEDHLRRSGMDRYFDCVITSVGYGKRKPSRLIFEHGLRVSNGRKETALYVGDSYPSDYEGARSAGIACLLIDPEHSYDIPAHDRLDHVLDLSSAIAAHR